MAKLLKLRRGTTTQHASFTGAEGEVTIDTTKDTAVIHDNSTQGGTPLAKEDMSNVSSASIAGRLGTDSIATTKIAAGALPTDVTVASANIVNGTIATGDIANNAVDYTKMSDIGGNVIMGRIGSSGGNPESLTAANVRTIINVEDGATADQTATEIKTLYESNSNTNPLTDTLLTKLNGIDTGAKDDQTASEILTAIKTVDGSGSGLDADNLDGRTWSESAGNSTIVSRNSSGYIFGNYLNMTSSFATSGATSGMGIFTGTNGSDNYARSYTAAAARTLLNVENGATAVQTGSEIGTALNGYNVGTSGTGVANVYCQGWFRNEDNGDGLYNQSTNQHWYSDSSSYWNMGGGTTNGGIRFRDNHASTVRGYIYYNNSNDIGLLNSAGSWSLKIDNSGNGTFTGNVTAYSDARLKTNVNTINDALSIVGKLRGVSFDWIESGKRSIGVIAQEVEAVLPELVLTQQVSTEQNPEPKEVKSVDYGKIVGVLINAINELKAEVDELKGGK